MSDVIDIEIPHRPCNTDAKQGTEISIYELSNKRCRWPIGHQAPFLYCGKKVAVKPPYCVDHMRLAWRCG